MQPYLLTFLLFLPLIFILPKNAFAYIDPNTGGYVFQILFPIISAIAGILIFFKNGVKRLIALIGRAVFGDKNK